VNRVELFLEITNTTRRTVSFRTTKKKKHKQTVLREIYRKNSKHTGTKEDGIHMISTETVPSKTSGVGIKPPNTPSTRGRQEH